MTLFRKPVKGDFVRNKVIGEVFKVSHNWGDHDLHTNRDNFEFVTVTPVEPPKGAYVNVYRYAGGLLETGIERNTRAEADEGVVEEGKTRIACINLALLEGRFDD